MILSDLLAALAGNAELKITLYDNDENQIITFNAAGYAAVESDISARRVRRVRINDAKAVSIFLVADTDTDEP